MIELKNNIDLIITNINKINTIYDKLFNDYRLQLDSSFFKVNENESDIFRDNNELLFLYSISYVYNLYHDRSQKNLDFIIGKMRGEQLNSSNEHKELINSLRTYFFHFLSDGRPKDRDKRMRVSGFYLEVCDKEEPISNQDWGKCAKKILKETNAFLKNIILYFESNDWPMLKKEWISSKKRELPVQEFKDSIKKYIMIYDIRIECDFYYKRIEPDLITEFKQLSHGNYHYKEIIDHMDRFIAYLIEKRTKVPPFISGIDILDFFDIAPGPEIKKIIDFANSQHQKNPNAENKEYYLNLAKEHFDLQLKGK